MTCFAHGAAIVCTRGSARKPRAEKPRCRHPECDRTASQSGWGCRQHWFKLPLSLRSRIRQAASIEVGANGRLGPAWTVVAEEADRWILEQLSKPPAPSWRQPELPL